MTPSPRKRAAGRTPAGPAAAQDAEARRFWSRVDQRGDSECWPWLGGKNSDGYGMFHWLGRTKGAHRLAYELTRGAIPEGLQLDHLRRTRHCVNPWHLEAVPSRVNTLRGVGISALNATKTHCPKRHEYTPENTYTDKLGRRYCRTCQHEAAKGRRRPREPQTRCKRGHELIPGNLYMRPNGARECRICRDLLRPWRRQESAA